MNLKIRILKLGIVFAGTALMGIGVTLFILSGQGIDPLSTMLAGFVRYLPMDLGTMISLFNMSVLGLSALVNHNYIGIGSIINAIFVGVFTNLWMDILMPFAGLPHFVMVALAIFAFTLGIAVYMKGNLGFGPVEAMMNILVDHTPLDIRKSRLILDMSYIIIGILLGAPYGYGTVLSAILISPLIGSFSNIIDSLKQVEFVRRQVKNVLS